MANLFDRFRTKVAEAQASEAAARREWQQKDTAVSQSLAIMRPLLDEFRRGFVQNGTAAKVVYYNGNAGFSFQVPLKWTIGVIKLENHRLSVYIESDPGKSNGYACDDYTARLQPPDLTSGRAAGSAELRAFLERAVQLFIDRYGAGLSQSGITGP